MLLSIHGVLGLAEYAKGFVRDENYGEHSDVLLIIAIISILVHFANVMLLSKEQTNAEKLNEFGYTHTEVEGLTY